MKKEYTLVELLGVIIVLTIIMTIVVVVMINIIKNTNERIDKATAKILYSASENYLKDKYILPANGYYKVTLKNLREDNRISDTFIESANDERITETSCVKVSITNGEMEYEFSYECD